MSRRPRRRPRAHHRLRALLRRLQGQPRLRARMRRTAYDAGARWVVLCDTNGGTLPEEVEAIIAAVTRVMPGEPCRHPHAQRHGKGGRQHAGGGAGGRAADPGHAERPRRALRQCQPHHRSSPRWLLKSRFATASKPASRRERLTQAHPRVAPAGRDAQPRAEPLGRRMSASRRSRTKAASTFPPCRKIRAPTNTCRRKRSAMRGKLLVSDQAGRSNILAELERSASPSNATIRVSARCWRRSSSAIRRLRLRGRRRLVRAAGAAAVSATVPRLFHRRGLPRDGGAAPQRRRPARHGVGGHRQR